MTSFKDIVIATSITWIKKYLDESDRSWKPLFEHFCKKENLSLFLQSNFDVNELPESMPSYYSESIRNWKIISYHKSMENLESNCIWYNTNIKIGGQSVYNRNLLSIGMWTISDLYDSNKNILPFNIWQSRGASNLDRFTWLGIVQIVKNKNNFWHSNIISSGILFKGKFISIHKVTVSQIKTLLTNVKYAKLRADDFKYKLKAHSIYGNIEEEIWQQLFWQCHSVPLDNNTKELQYKILMRYVNTNVLLYKMNKVSSNRCTFCMLEPETIEHLFFHCFVVKNIWFNIFHDWGAKSNCLIQPSLKICVLGILDDLGLADKDCIALYTLTLIFKSYVMQCKVKENELSIIAFKRILGYRVELLATIYDNDMFRVFREIALE